MRPGYETPDVTVNSFRVLPSESTTPTFEIGLHVVNPNRESLRLDGISYTIALQDREVIKGVGKDFPVIEGYSAGDLKIEATASLYQGIRLIGDLMRDPAEALEYRIEAKLDLGAFRPSIRVVDSGEISLNSSRRGEGNNGE